MQTLLENWLEILIGLVIVIFVIYLVGSIAGSSAIVKSTLVSDLVTTADQVYYLPTACLSIKAVATVILKKDTATNSLLEARHAGTSFETTIQTVPDTTCGFALTYNASIFSNDELTFSINAQGLLEGVNVTAEDRITNIITQFAEAPQLIIPGAQAPAAPAAAQEVAGGFTFETKEYTANFFIRSEEIRSGSCSRTWTINIDGTANTNTTVDASFTLKFPTPAPPMTFTTATGEFALLTRPLQTVRMQVFKGNPSLNTTPDSEHQLIIPDESKVVSIKLERSAFVKKTYKLKITNGVFTENVINKPSEIEGFASIPIKIAKAIVSIPTQLFQFRINQITRQTSLETAQQNLLKAQAQTEKEKITAESGILKASVDAHNAMLTSQTTIMKASLDAEKELLTAQKDLITAKSDLETARKKLEEVTKSPGK